MTPRDEELRRLRAISKAPTVRAAADACGLKPNALRAWLTRDKSRRLRVAVRYAESLRARRVRALFAQWHGADVAKIQHLESKLAIPWVLCFGAAYSRYFRGLWVDQ